MRGRTTLILAALAILAWLVVSNLGEPPPPVNLRQPLVPDSLIGDLEEIDLNLLSDEILRLSRDPGGDYRIVFGRDAKTGERWIYEDQANDLMVDQLLNALSSSWREPLAGEFSADDMVRSQLDPPRYRVVLKGAGQELVLDFGALDPTGQGILAREQGSQKVFRATPQVPNLMERNLQEWRSKEVYGFTTQTVSRLEVVVHRADQPDPSVLVVERGAGNLWEVQFPRRLRADENRVRSLIHRLTSLRIDSFLTMELTEEIQQAGGLPEGLAQITLQSGGFLETLVVGKPQDDGSIPCLLMQRGETMTFALKTAELAPILDATVDDLRPRRLTPSIESSLVEVECRAGQGDKPLRWSVQRQGKSPIGDWRLTAPVEAWMHTGQGARSFAQVVSDLDAVEYLEFLPRQEDFQPLYELTLRWKSGPILRDVTACLRPDGDGVILHTTEEPDEFFRASGTLLDICELPMELYQKRRVFPLGAEFRPTVLQWDYRPRDGDAVVLERTEDGTVGVVRGPPDRNARLTSATNRLFGADAHDLLRPFDIDVSFEDPELVLRLKTEDGTNHELVVGPRGPEGFYCTLTPRFEGLVLVIPAGSLEELREVRLPR